jgi:hypothetical protein
MVVALDRHREPQSRLVQPLVDQRDVLVRGIAM